MKEKWINFYTRLAAGTVTVGSVIAAGHMAKKYGENPNQKLVKLNPYNVADYAVNKFLNTDDEKIQKLFALFSKK